jgi:uncharacterized membrane protein SpoIIM required for sporulation
MLLKHLTLSAAAVYLTGVLVGFYIDPSPQTGYPDDLVPLHFLEQTKSQLLWSIAGNNITVALINLFGGFSLGMVSLLNTFYNGVILGYACSVAMDQFPVMVLLGHLLPHAIEILAIILSCSLGLYLGRYLINHLLLDTEAPFDFRLFTLLTALTVAILLAAAVLEVTISFSR